MKNFITALTFMACASSAFSETSEWRILGPAVTWHHELDSAPIVVPATAQRKAVRQWNELNPAIGLEHRKGYESHFVQIANDSHGFWGVMAGRKNSSQIFTGENFSSEIGLAYGVWYRSIATDKKKIVDGVVSMETKFEKALVPFLFPMASLIHNTSQTHLNVAIVPKLTMKGKNLVPTSTVIFQLSFPF